MNPIRYTGLGFNGEWVFYRQHQTLPKRRKKLGTSKVPAQTVSKMNVFLPVLGNGLSGEIIK